MAEVVNQKVLDDIVESPLNTVKKLSIQDIAFIWWKTCEAIAESIAETKGVEIGGFCTFSLETTTRLEAEPIFVLSEKFIQRYSMNKNPTGAAKDWGNVPITPLNLLVISQKAQCDRATVDNCVHEIVQAFGKRLSDVNGISLDFPGIGRLTSKHGKIKFRFFREFLDQPGPTDEPWGRHTLQSRCGTAGVYDYRPNSSPSPRGQTPRLLRTPNYSLQGLGGTQFWELDSAELLTVRPPTRCSSRGREGVSATLPPIPEAKAVGSSIAWQNHFTGMAGIMNPVHREEIEEVLAGPRRPAELPPLPDVDESEVETQQKLAQRALNSSLFRPMEPLGELVSAAEKAVTWEYGKGPIASLDLQPLQANHKRDNALAQSETLKARPDYDHQHPPSGMCYVCHQRSKSEQNPALKDESTRKAKEWEQAVTAASKYNQDILENINQKMAAQKKQAEIRTATFNWTAMQEVPPEEDPRPMADIFCFRPPTSGSQIRQQNEAYGEDISAQANEALLNQFISSQMQLEVERQEQLQLAIALQEEEARRREAKAKAHAKYHQDLSGQIATKENIEAVKESLHPRTLRPQGSRSGLSSADGHRGAITGPIFFQDEKLRQKEKAAFEKQTYQHQIEQEARKKREVLARKQEELEREQRFLVATQESFRNDLILEAQHQAKTKVQLESDWLSAMTQKQQREQEEHQFRVKSAGIPILEQTKSYPRCTTCERDPSNTGETRIIGSTYMTSSTSLP